MKIPPNCTKKKAHIQRVFRDDVRPLNFSVTWVMMGRHTARREEEEKKVSLYYTMMEMQLSLSDEEPLHWSLVLWGIVAETIEGIGHQCRWRNRVSGAWATREEAGRQKRRSGILKVWARAQQIFSTGDDLHTDGWAQRLHSLIALEKGSNVSSHSRHSQWISGCYSRPPQTIKHETSLLKVGKAVENFST